MRDETSVTSTDGQLASPVGPRIESTPNPRKTLSSSKIALALTESEDERALVLVSDEGSAMKNAPDSSDGDAGTGSPRALRQPGSNARRSITKPELAMCGACLVVLLALLVFEASGRIAFLLAVGMLWALGQVDRPARSKSAVQRALDADAKADDEYRQRSAAWAALARNEEEATWKSDS